MSKAKKVFVSALLLLINCNVYANHYEIKKSGDVILDEVSLYKGDILVFKGAQQTLPGEFAYFNLGGGLNSTNLSISINSDIKNGFLHSDIKANYAPNDSKVFFGFNKDYKLYFMSGEKRSLILCESNMNCTNSEYQLTVRQTILK